MGDARSLASFDLNLLVQLRLLLEEGSVSRAAGRANVTQSAMSRSLARLRAALGDPLLVQVGRGMELTAFAHTLVEPTRAVLQQIDAKILSAGAFSPATAERVFSIAAVDLAEVLLLVPWINTLASSAPGIAINLTGPQAAFRDGLARGELDLVIGVATGDRASLKQRALLRDTYVTVMRSDHPLAQKPALEPSDHQRHPHVLVSPSGRGEGLVDVALETLGMRRRVAVRVGSFLTALQFIASSDLLLTAPRMIGAHAVHSGGLVFRETGLDLPPLTLSMLWSATRAGDLGHTWLRDSLVTLAGRLPLAR